MNRAALWGALVYFPISTISWILLHRMAADHSDSDAFQLAMSANMWLAPIAAISVTAVLSGTKWLSAGAILGIYVALIKLVQFSLTSDLSDAARNLPDAVTQALIMMSYNAALYCVLVALASIVVRQFLYPTRKDEDSKREI